MKSPVFTSTLLVSALAGFAGAQEAPKADPAAVAMMRQVYEKRETWAPDFPGFTAKLTVQLGGKEQQGTVSVGKDRKVEVQLAGEEAQAWAEDALASIVGHRAARRFEEADGRYPLTLGVEDGHPAGRLIHLNDKTSSTYRVRDGQLLQINRAAGPKLRFTIDMVESVPTEGGRLLPRVFTVSYFDSEENNLVKTDTIWDGYQKVGKYYLPEFRRQVTAENGHTDAFHLRLNDIKLRD